MDDYIREDMIPLSVVLFFPTSHYRRRRRRYLPPSRVRTTTVEGKRKIRRDSCFVYGLFFLLELYPRLDTRKDEDGDEPHSLAVSAERRSSEQ